MNGSRCLRVNVAVKLAWLRRLERRHVLPGEAARNRESGNEVSQAILVDAILLREEPFERSLEPERCKGTRSAVTGSNDEDHLQIMVADKKVQMRPYKDDTGTCSPVSFEC